MKKVLSMLMAVVKLVSTVSIQALQSSAADVDYTTMSTNGTWYQGYISESNTVEWYKFTIPSDGTVTIKLMHYMRTSYSLYNSDLSNALTDDAWQYSGNSSSPETSTFSYDLSKGTYYIKISKLDTGKFKVNASFKLFNNNETEPNGYENAMYLPADKTITGALTIQDEVDWYKINIPSKCSASVYLTHYMRTSYSLYNSDLSNALTDDAWRYGGSSSSPETSTFSYDLPKGTYYIKIRKLDTGKYKLSWKMNVSVSRPNDFRISSRGTKSLKLAWNEVSGVSGYQLQRKSGDSYKTVANTKSTSYTVSKLSAGTSYAFRVRAYKTIDGKKYYSSWRTLTTPTKPLMPSIKAPSTNKKHQIIVKWNRVSKCTGYQVQFSRKKNFSSVIATKTVSGSSKTSYTGKNFTKGKTYYVRVRAYKTVNGTKYCGAWSKVKSIKCK